jgi:hypothetical protein
MKTSIDSLLRFTGLKVQGDIGPLTCYTSRRNRIVWYLRAPPEQPPSPLQISQRNRFRGAASTWRSLPAATRATWIEAAKLAHLRISGYCLWTYHIVADRDDIIRTIERQSGTSLLA